MASITPGSEDTSMAKESFRSLFGKNNTLMSAPEIKKSIQGILRRDLECSSGAHHDER